MVFQLSINMTVESTTVAHGNTTVVVPNGDASNGNIIPSSKKPRESDRGCRRRRKQKKKSNKASSRAPDVEEAEADPQQPQVCEQIEIEYVLEQLELEDGFSDEFKQIFDKFSFREPVASEEDEAKKDESEENKDEDDEEKEEKVMISKKQKKVERRMKIGELKQESARPDVVEVWDATSAVPKLLVFLKSCRNTVPVPRHWSHKRKYLQGKRGVEKAPFRLPDFIAATGIQEIRQAYIDGNKKKLKLKQKQREERMKPKMGKMEIDYQVLHDAFFKYQTKPKLSALGDLYFEGKEFEVKPRRETRPGTLLSHGLKEALGLAQGAPPPWLINIFGVQQQDQPNYEDEPIDKSKHWGDLEEEEEEEEEEMEEEEELEDGMESVDTMSSIETPPDAIELRKEQRKEPDRALYQVLEEEKGESVAPGTLLAPTHTYVIKTATQDKSGAKRVDLLKGHKKTDRVDVSLRPEELEALENVLPAKYEEAREEEKLRNKPEDFSDMVAENNSKKRKRDKEGKKKRDFKF